MVGCEHSLSTPALLVLERQCLDSERKYRLMNKLINYKGGYRTAPATPGLLILTFRPKEALAGHIKC